MPEIMLYFCVAAWLLGTVGGWVMRIIWENHFDDENKEGKD